MWVKAKNHSGFTIVELLIVIVVIGILAAITIVAFNGVQQRANNSKTSSALSTWMKTLNLYKVDNGRWPGGLVCLGSGYSYGVSGNDSSGTAQCRQDSAGSGVVENAAFFTAMKPYLGGGATPTPAFVTASASDTSWRRGLSYYYGGGDGTQVYIVAAFAGSPASCPVVSGVTSSLNVVGTNWSCIYYIGHTTDT